MRRAACFRAIGLLFALTLMSIPNAGADVDPFPQFDCIAPNVAFWTKVYAQYSTAQGIVHDSQNLNIIYAIIDLKPYDAPGARKINRKRIRLATAKYEALLRGLARHPHTTSPEYDRVADMFGPERQSAVFRRAASQVRIQVGQKDRFLAGLRRSGAYLGQIREIFKTYNLPQDLAYLPHVESSFNPQAYSKFGAAGMWQFTRSTGRRFMQVDYVVDERRDPIQATHAAAQLLKENHAKLGSWPLAITAYNHGAAGMERAKSAHGDYPSIFQDYRGRVFKFASRNFYSEFLAARQVAQNYESFFGGLTLDQPRRTLAVQLEGYASLKDLGHLFGIDAETLKALNPALRPPVFSGQKLVPKGYTLRLPVEAADSHTQLLAEIPPALYQSTQKPSRFYTVQRGDSAGKIARMHRIHLNDLILANNLNRRATIYPHQTLRIPLAGEVIQLAQHAPVKDPKPALLTADGTATETEPEVSGDQEEAPQYPPPVLASVIPLPAQSAPPKPEKTDPSAAEAEPNLEIVTADVHMDRVVSQKGYPVGIIQVEVEETLGHYAEWANVRTWQIRNLNGLRFGSLLNLHQKIKIPLNRTTAQKFEENRYEFHKRLQEDFFAVYRVGDVQPYGVRQGDNFWTLSHEKFDLPMWLIKHYNPQIDLADLRQNQILMIPSIEKATDDEPGMDTPDVSDNNPADQGEDTESISLKNINSHLFP